MPFWAWPFRRWGILTFTPISWSESTKHSIFNLLNYRVIYPTANTWFLDTSAPSLSLRPKFKHEMQIREEAGVRGCFSTWTHALLQK